MTVINLVPWSMKFTTSENDEELSSYEIISFIIDKTVRNSENKRS